MTLSFIIPVYNAELYINKCVDSIVSQNFTSFEIILVDDGSTDGSGALCDEISERNKCVRTFHKENGGVSSARNYGLEHAIGEWIWFVDADDYILPDSKDVIESAIKENCQLVALSYITEVNESRKVVFNADQLCKQNICDKYHLLNSIKSSPSSCTHLFKLDIIRKNNLEISKRLKFGEDKLFVTEYTYYIDSALLTKKPVYEYVYNKNSTVHRAFLNNDRELQDQLLSALILLEDANKRNIKHNFFDVQILYLVANYLKYSFYSQNKTTDLQNRFADFYKKTKKLGYISIVLFFVKMFFPLFRKRPYLFYNRFLPKYALFKQLKFLK